MLTKILRLSLHVYNCNQIHDIKHVGLNMKYLNKRKKKRMIKEIRNFHLPHIGLVGFTPRWAGLDEMKKDGLWHTEAQPAVSV